MESGWTEMPGCEAIRTGQRLARTSTIAVQVTYNNVEQRLSLHIKWNILNDDGSRDNFVFADEAAASCAARRDGRRLYGNLKL